MLNLSPERTNLIIVLFFNFIRKCDKQYKYYLCTHSTNLNFVEIVTNMPENVYIFNFFKNKQEIHETKFMKICCQI